MTGSHYGIDNKAPYDLAGGAVTTTKPFDTSTRTGPRPDPPLVEWRSRPALFLLRSPKGWHQPLPLTELSDGRLVAGEFRGLTTSTGRLTVLTPITSERGNWQTKAPVPQPIADAGADTVGGLLYVVGGKISETNRISSVHVYNS